MPDVAGILVIDKPPGLTSHDVVARLRRMLGMRRIGHGGTLDPFATGVLPIAVGRATRVLGHVQSSGKAYEAHVVLGVETDSGDIEGERVERHEPSRWPSSEQVQDVLRSFIGTIEQVPPAHSAIKVGGQPLYKRARSGEADIVVPSRNVTIYALEVRAYEPPDVVLGVVCGSGTYVRALARDIGRSLGTGAYCHALRRTNTGPFCLGDAWTLDELAEMEPKDNWPEIALAADAALIDLPAVILGRSQTSAWYHGRPVDLEVGMARHGPGPTRVYDARGRFAGVGNWDGRSRLTADFVWPPDTGSVR
jgi:tRNA pseudouridine55 synthase